MSGWDRELATIWTNNVAPSRPSHSEMFVYTQYLVINKCIRMNMN